MDTRRTSTETQSETPATPPRWEGTRGGGALSNPVLRKTFLAGQAKENSKKFNSFTSIEVRVTIIANTSLLQASNEGIDFPEFDFPDANDDDEAQDVEEEEPEEDDLDASSRATESTRYVKYAGGRPPPPGRPHAARALVDRHRDDYGSLGPRSSALSDTSEAPSLASHVKNVRIPSHTSDLDQYLDDLFNPVLDGNLDELSDAR